MNKIVKYTIFVFMLMIVSVIITFASYYIAMELTADRVNAIVCEECNCGAGSKNQTHIS